MKLKPLPHRHIGVLISMAMIFTSFIGTAFAATIEQETLNHIDALRAIKAQASPEDMAVYNKQMDDGWRFFDANKNSVIPILRRELSLEIKKGSPNDLVLLDIGFYLRRQENKEDQELAKQALIRLDPTSDIIRLNQQQLFYFSYSVAQDRDPNMIAFLDKAFLRENVTAFVPQHFLTLNDRLTCIFLYGLLGQAAEQHLQTLLKDKSLAPKIIEILISIGSRDSVPFVKAAMMNSRDYDTFTRATSFMMQLGGPEGRATMLSINPKIFDAKSQEYYAKIRPAIEAASYESLRQELNSIPGADTSGKLDAHELKKRLLAMYEHYGKDDITSPIQIVDSELPRDSLIKELMRIRARIFYRLSDEALDDVSVTNAIINTLYYKN